MKITRRQLRRIIREAIEADPMVTINQALEDSIPVIAKKISQNRDARVRQVRETWAGTQRSGTLTYQFMSTWGAHDDDLWNSSTQQSRQVVLDNLVKHGAVIESAVPPMNDFGTPGVNFSLGGQSFELVTTGYRYDVEIYVKGIS